MLAKCVYQDRSGIVRAVSTLFSTRLSLQALLGGFALIGLTLRIAAAQGD